MSLFGDNIYRLRFFTGSDTVYKEYEGQVVNEDPPAQSVR